MFLQHNLRNWIRNIHLWLGFSSGLVVFVIAVTGCLYAFQSEIQDMTQSYRFTPKQNKLPLPPSVLKSIAEKELPAKKIHAVLYGKLERSAQVIFYNFEPDYYYFIVYLNPYSGEVVKVKDMRKDFFQTVLQGHFYLWLPPTIGQPIVASVTLVFVVMLISGFILWWPRKRGSVKQRFKIKWKARWRRRNYDLHNVLGFYIISIAMVLALTGLVWGFQWFRQTVYGISGGKKTLQYYEPPSDSSVIRSGSPSTDTIWNFMRNKYPNAETMEIHIPELITSPVAANANPDEKTFWKTDYRYFDQYTLKELPVEHIYGRFSEADAADKLLRLNYDIHTGAILGLPGKFLMFLASLIVASLPITGFFVWYNRKFKKERKKELGYGLSGS